MATLTEEGIASSEKKVASGHGKLIEPSSLSHLAIGTFVTTDPQKTRKLLVDFLGMECVEYAPGRMMARDRRAKYLMEHGDPDFFVLDVAETQEIRRPQALLNHWGFSVASKEEVDRIREIALRQAEEFYLKKIFPTTPMHGSYGFYFIDGSDNWWEIEFRNGVTNDMWFSKGDWNAEGRDAFPIANPPLAIAPTTPAILGDEAFMTHGTTAVADTNVSRVFYEEILGLRTVAHVPPAICTSGGSDFGIVSVSAGRKIQDQGPENRFVLLVDGDELVADFHARVQDGAERYRLRSVSEIGPDEVEGKSFRVRTEDGIWFEISSRPRQRIVDIFEQPATSRH
jgi:catechol 2,3-dioxygenase-like lactoylglutathione lyase family enzyme